MSYSSGLITKENPVHEKLHSSPEEDLAIVVDYHKDIQNRREIMLPKECHTSRLHPGMQTLKAPR